ncbi:MAG: histidine kinase [Candidatus Aminicenantales bacterium]
MIHRKKRYPLFWILQTSGWLLYLAASLISFWVRGSLTTSIFVRYTASAIAGFLATLSLRYFYRRIQIQDRSLYSLSLITILYSFLGANFLIWISNFLRYPYSVTKALTVNPTFLSYLNRVIWWFTPLIGWSALYLGIKFWQEWMIQKERTEKANALIQTAQLQMLRYRMNPHFLFNALNSIRALISEDKTSAKRMVTELSEFLRYSLVSRNYENVPFKDEIESVRHFFNIQKMRYENKLEVAFDIDPAADEYPIESFLIHPLAENAMKHGMRTSPMPLQIRIKARVHHGSLQIEVINSGSWIEPSDQKNEGKIGAGLDNVRLRLKDSYPESHHFEIFEKEGFVHARLDIEKGIRR